MTLGFKWLSVLSWLRLIWHQLDLLNVPVLVMCNNCCCWLSSVLTYLKLCTVSSCVVLVILFNSEWVVNAVTDLCDSTLNHLVKSWQHCLASREHLLLITLHADESFGQWWKEAGTPFRGPQKPLKKRSGAPKCQNFHRNAWFKSFPGPNALNYTVHYPLPVISDWNQGRALKVC